MTLDEAITLLSKQLSSKYQQGTFSIGRGKDSIHLYGHNKNVKKFKLEIFENWPVKYKYVGKISPL